ncbi:MAG: fasciclin domain-containing protein [Candidatus Nanopelagicales bacterium]
MRLRRTTASLVAAAAVATGALAAAPAASASSPGTPGTTSLAAVLLSDGDTFDGNANDFDIVTQAALAVLAAKPDSPVKVLTDGSVPLTAFIPRDQAFRLFVYSTTGKWIRSEEGVFNAVASFGIDTVEAVLLYHVVPGATITRAAALKADGAALTTAQGGTLTVDIVPNRKIMLRDLDPDATDARVRWDAYDINKGNLQIAHGIDRVLRPLDLPKA